jgi:hypothetical protein
VGALACHTACTAPPAEAPTWGTSEQLTAAPGAHRNPGRALVRQCTTATCGAHTGVTSRVRCATVQPQVAWIE